MGFFKYYPIYVFGGYCNDFYIRPFVNSFEFFSPSTTFCQIKDELVITIIIILRPIGVGEVIRRVIAKCVTGVTKRDIIDASGTLKVCAGLKSGAEAAIHAMHGIFDADDTDAVLLIDASNAFNSLNRASAMHNVAVLCPI